jgi:hypothetical protein
MSKSIDFKLYEYRDNGEIGISIVYVQGNIAVVSEVEPYGTVLLNHLEKIAERICKDFGIERNELVLIEHNTSNEYHAEDLLDIVKFEVSESGFKNPKWIPLEV